MRKSDDRNHQRVVRGANVTNHGWLDKELEWPLETEQLVQKLILP